MHCAAAELALFYVFRRDVELAFVFTKLQKPCATPHCSQISRNFNLDRFEKLKITDLEKELKQQKLSIVTAFHELKYT